MKIQFNTDSDIEGKERISDYFSSSIKKELNRFQTNITRIEVHLSDENGNKDGHNDKRCLLEARLTNIKPIAVSHQGNSHEEAINGAIDKLKTSLDTTLGRLNNKNSSK